MLKTCAGPGPTVGAPKRIRKLRGLVALCVVALMLVAAESAAAGGWVPRNVPGKQAYNGRSTAVSCSSSTACMSVGSFLNPSGGQRALTAVWNGSIWTPKAVPVPSGATRTRLAGVSCTAANACTAVGSYSIKSSDPAKNRDQLPLVVRWNGSAWALQTVPLPTGTTLAYLRGVACTAADTCKAVGGYRSGSVKSRALVEHWNGASWAFRTPTNPSGATFSSLNGISCTGTVCVAVGDYTTDPAGDMPNKPFAERFNGSVWAPQSIPAPGGATTLSLNGVSCSAAAACTAVGRYTDANPTYSTPVVARWDGAGWKLQDTPAKPFLVWGQGFDAVSCVSATSCTAVGPEVVGYATGPDYGTPLVQHWDGVNWTEQPTPKPAAGGFFLAWASGVSCTAGGCTAVGGSSAFGDSSDAASTLAIRQTAGSTAWKLQTTPSGTGAIDTRLADVSCVSATSCTGVGMYFDSKARGPVVARWNGTSWAQQTPGASLGSGRNGDGLQAVSCSSTSACMAVGDYIGPSNTDLGVAQKWNGTSWSSHAMPVPPDASSIRMKSVACTSATACFAVGSYSTSGSQYVPLLERWDGARWSIVDIPDSSGSRDGLNAVACSAGNACTAVGGTLVLRWNGISWTRQNIPLPDGTQFADLTDVSCPTRATAPRPCTAVGGYSTYSPYYATTSLIERWNGTSWTLQSSAIAGMTDVACAALTSCTAVGGYTPAQRWDGGDWTPDGYMPGYQYGVSCSAANDCTSVGGVDGNELVVRDIFAGVVLANRTVTPAAARYSATQPGASAPTAGNQPRTPALREGGDAGSPVLVRSN